eukprot:Colp12_sorted_trinity150504_noHs@12676
MSQATVDVLQGSLIKAWEKLMTLGSAAADDGQIKDHVVFQLVANALKEAWQSADSLGLGFDAQLQVRNNEEQATAIYKTILGRLKNGLKSRDPTLYQSNYFYQQTQAGVVSYVALKDLLVSFVQKLYPRANYGIVVYNEEVEQDIAETMRMAIFEACQSNSTEMSSLNVQVVKWLTYLSRKAESMKKLTRQASEAATPGIEEDIEYPDLVASLAQRILDHSRMQSVCFVTPEIGKWSTYGGLGVMVDELTQRLATLGSDVMVISPYYDQNLKGETNYLSKDGIVYTQNIETYVGSQRVEVGVHEGKVNGVHYYFLHNAFFFPRAYPESSSATYQLQVIILFAKASLELLCRLGKLPDLIVTNDWFAGMTAAYAKQGEKGPFGKVFNNTKFFHIVHNMEEDYQGRIYPEAREGTLNEIHHLNSVDLLVDPMWQKLILNPTRCALLASDQWGTVSPTYRDNLLEPEKPLAPILRQFPCPFAHVNGLDIAARKRKQEQLPVKTHEEAKTFIQRKYFKYENGDPTVPLFCFVGRITKQKGVHLILDSVDHLVSTYNGKILILIGGKADTSPYSVECAAKMHALRERYPSCFWANPNEFFTDGPIINLGADFGLMPSLFEPGGIVQHEFFMCGTPVISFQTGGLKDTVHEYNKFTRQGNGFTLQAHNVSDIIFAIDRALLIFRDAENAHYKQLRENAAQSVMDLSKVAWAWFKEFHRCGQFLLRRSETEALEKLLHT